MGQRTTAAAEQQAGSALRRMILLLAVAAVMAAMMVAMASPAFASPSRNVCDHLFPKVPVATALIKTRCLLD